MPNNDKIAIGLLKQSLKTQGNRKNKLNDWLSNIITKPKYNKFLSEKNTRSIDMCDLKYYGSAKYDKNRYKRLMCGQDQENLSLGRAILMKRKGWDKKGDLNKKILQYHKRSLNVIAEEIE